MRQDYKQRIEELKTANANLESERQELERADQEVDISIKSIYESEESSRLASHIYNLKQFDNSLIIIFLTILRSI